MVMGVRLINAKDDFPHPARKATLPYGCGPP